MAEVQHVHGDVIVVNTRSVGVDARKAGELAAGYVTKRPRVRQVARAFAAVAVVIIWARIEDKPKNLGTTCESTQAPRTTGNSMVTLKQGLCNGRLGEDIGEGVRGKKPKKRVARERRTRFLVNPFSRTLKGVPTGTSFYESISPMATAGRHSASGT